LLGQGSGASSLRVSSSGIAIPGTLAVTGAATFSDVTASGAVTSTSTITAGTGFTTSGVILGGAGFQGSVKSVSGAALYLATQSSHFIVMQTNNTDRWYINGSGHLSTNGALNATIGGTLAVTGAATFGSYTVGTVPSVSTYVRGLIYVSDESGGATLAYSNGTNWKRVYDNANIS
jgi:hypothetical protein